MIRFLEAARKADTKSSAPVRQLDHQHRPENVVWGFNKRRLYRNVLVEDGCRKTVGAEQRRVRRGGGGCGTEHNERVCDRIFDKLQGTVRQAEVVHLEAGGPDPLDCYKNVLFVQSSVLLNGVGFSVQCTRCNVAFAAVLS